MKNTHEIKIKRVYEAPSSNDGARILVDRLWPRGVSKEKASVAEWWKDIAPSDALRKWFGHEPDRFTEFAKKYADELKQNPAVAAHVETCRKLLAQGNVTLVYAAKDETMNNAAVLAKCLHDAV